MFRDLIQEKAGRMGEDAPAKGHLRTAHQALCRAFFAKKARTGLDKRWLAVDARQIGDA